MDTYQKAVIESEILTILARVASGDKHWIADRLAYAMGHTGEFSYSNEEVFNALRRLERQGRIIHWYKERGWYRRKIYQMSDSERKRDFDDLPF